MHERDANGLNDARALYVHYNTLRHRLERIEQILGPVLDDPEQRLNLALALRVARMLAC